jgi:integrase
MNFVERSAGLDPNAGVIAYVTPDRVARYEAELKKRVGSVTTYGSIYKLRRTAQLLNPAADLEWLCDLEKDLALVMQPRSKFGRLVYSQVLLKAGLTLMTEADSVMEATPLRRARQFRNGLMVAFLAFHPIRLKNFAALDLGRTFRKVENDWWIVLPAIETKEKRHDERKVDPSLVPWIELYLAQYRPALNRRHGDDMLLWSSTRGSPMTYNAIERVIKASTLATTGVDVCPHLFRTSGASTVATSAPSTPGLATALLHHSDPGVTEENYNRAKSADAARSFGALIRQYRKRG